MTGPVLVKQDLGDAKANVEKRISYIKGEMYVGGSLDLCEYESLSSIYAAPAWRSCWLSRRRSRKRRGSGCVPFPAAYLRAGMLMSGQVQDLQMVGQKLAAEAKAKQSQ